MRRPAPSPVEQPGLCPGRTRACPELIRVGVPEVNYVEHDGVQRAVSADGKREPFGVGHAWNADHVLSNSVLANLQRHSDHHMHAWTPYPELQALPGPQLPTDDAGAVLLAAVPPLWFAVMDRRLATAAAAPAAGPALA